MSSTSVSPRRSHWRRRLIIAAGMLLAIVVGSIALTATTNFFYSAGSLSNEPSRQTDGLAVTPAPRSADLPGRDVSPSHFGFGRSSETDLAYDSYLQLQTKDPSAAMQEAVQMVRDRGGSVESLVMRRGDENSASAQFLIPSNRAMKTLEDLTALGVAAKQQLTATDMGATNQGVQDQISTAQAEVNRLAQLVSGADPSVKPYYERQLRQAQSQLSSAQSQLSSVQKQVSFTSVSIRMTTEPVNFSSGGVSSLTYAAAKGWSGMLGTFGLLFTAIAFLLPFLFATVLLVLLGLVALRILRRGWAAVRPTLLGEARIPPLS